MRISDWSSDVCSSDLLGLTDLSHARPFQAAWTSALAFSIGALLPLVTVLAAPGTGAAAFVIGVAVATLALLGAVSATLGGAPRGRAVVRVAIGGAAGTGSASCRERVGQSV